LLVGDLGAGKTTLTRGLAAGFGVDPDDVSSPTFTLVNRYSGRIPVYHIDLYRIGPDETFELGLDEILDDPRAAVIIEWADRLGDQEVDGAWRVTLSWVDSRTRRIEMLTAGRRQP
jgi:tRNA threonylcarbamoyladenosine biosynthesis protein TsaE